MNDIYDERCTGPAVRQWAGNAVGPTAQWQRHQDETDLIRHLFASRWTISEIARYLDKDRAQIVRVLEAA